MPILLLDRPGRWPRRRLGRLSCGCSRWRCGISAGAPPLVVGAQAYRSVRTGRVRRVGQPGGLSAARTSDAARVGQPGGPSATRTSDAVRIRLLSCRGLAFARILGQRDKAPRERLPRVGDSVAFDPGAVPRLTPRPMVAALSVLTCPAAVPAFAASAKVSPRSAAKVVAQPRAFRVHTRVLQQSVWVGIFQQVSCPPMATPVPIRPISFAAARPALLFGAAACVGAKPSRELLTSLLILRPPAYPRRAGSGVLRSLCLDQSRR